jgi:hypothetical protein
MIDLALHLIGDITLVLAPLRGANLFLAEIVPDRAGGELGVRQREVFSIR